MHTRGARRYSAGGRSGRPAMKRSRTGFGGDSSQSARRSNRRRPSTIDPSRFVKAAKPVTEEVFEPHHSFDDFNMEPVLKQNLKARGFVQPSRIQDSAIPLALTGRDVVGIANTGTGKTAAFLLPLCNRIIRGEVQQAIIMAPTRELALQIQEELRMFAAGARIRDVLLIGGAPIHRQINDLRRKPAVVIGTPGRIKDHLERQTLDLARVGIVVLDEVDRMLDMGFVHDIRHILNHVSKKRQSLFFSATMEASVRTLIDTFTTDAQTVMARTSETSDNVDQSVIYCERSEKIEKLHDVLISEAVEKTLVFTETKHGADRLARSLSERGFKVDAIHGNKTQSKRQRTLGKFKNNEINVLVATDVAARGIDVKDISHIVNYEIPQTYDDYTHRIGRVGRAGRIGYAITLVEN